MKLLDINKCHVDSPDFKADLATLEVSAQRSHRREVQRVFSLSELFKADMFLAMVVL